MKISILSFTDNGEALAVKLEELLAKPQTGSAMVSCARCNRPLSLSEWTTQNFDQSDALVFVGAAGIAVRAISPFVKSKVTDPAVVVVDEKGQFAIPVLSGHLGGANDLARTIADGLGATPVITTATDVNGVFAIDEWTKRQGLHIVNPERIKTVSSALLAGETVRVASEWPVEGTPPKGVEVVALESVLELGEQTRAEGASRTLERGQRSAVDHPDIVITNKKSIADQFPDALLAVPTNMVLGIGCKRNTLPVSFEMLWGQVQKELDLLEEAVDAVSSIDIKKDEPGLLAFCTVHNWQLFTFSAARLREAEGEFTASFFVRNVTGVDNVCERSAVVLSGGRLLLEKTTGNGVTMAVAEKPMHLTWHVGSLEAE